jgi:hypothetical protein
MKLTMDGAGLPTADYSLYSRASDSLISELPGLASRHSSTSPGYGSPALYGDLTPENTRFF